jgi:hypothetical protein
MAATMRMLHIALTDDERVAIDAASPTDVATPARRLRHCPNNLRATTDI